MDMKLGATPAPSHEVSLFGMRIAAIDMRQAASTVLDQALAPHAATLRYVVTPNVDHVVQFQTSAALREAYANASLVVADGRPIVAASRWLGAALPGTVPGSDLVPALFDAALQQQRRVRVYLFGAGPGVAEAAGREILVRWGAVVEVVGAVSPEFGFDKKPELCSQYAQQISASCPDVLLVGLGAPKQELFVCQQRHTLRAGVALCIGATLDFLAGEKSRAPLWVQRLGLEWCYRMLQEPRRLVKRYAYDAWVFPRILLREYWYRRSQRTRGGN